MRIVAGRLGGRKLQGPGKDTESLVRPTTDRVRESVFNSLSSLDVIEGAKVLDLFAGTGACGIEALSRGAASVTFVDSSQRVCRLIRSNLDSVGETAQVVSSDALKFAATGEFFDLALVDPPYGWSDWPTLLAELNSRIVVCEESREVVAPLGWETVKSRSYGQTVVTILRRAS